MVWPFKSKDWNEIGTPMSQAYLRSLLMGEGITDIRLNDKDYMAIPLDDFMKLAWAGKRTFIDYDSELADCDDQCLFFEADTRAQWAKKGKDTKRALAFGRANVIMGGSNGAYGNNPHAIIWQIDNMGSLNWIEPQRNKTTHKPIVIYSVQG